MSKKIVQHVGVQDWLAFELFTECVAVDVSVLLDFREVQGEGSRIPLQHATLVVFLNTPVVGDEGSGVTVDEVGGDNDFRTSSEERFEIPQFGVRAQFCYLFWTKIKSFQPIAQLIHLTN